MRKNADRPSVSQLLLFLLLCVWVEVSLFCFVFVFVLVCVCFCGFFFWLCGVCVCVGDIWLFGISVSGRKTKDCITLSFRKKIYIFQQYSTQFRYQSFELCIYVFKNVRINFHNSGINDLSKKYVFYFWDLLVDNFL